MNWPGVPPIAASELASAERFFASRRIAEALACYDRALALGASFDAGLEHRWTCLMLLGQFERAWRETDRTEQERRRLARSQDESPPHLRRVWDGTPLHGRQVRIRCYHGLGDTIQFIRYVPLVQCIARDCCVEVQDALRPLLPFPTCFRSGSSGTPPVEVELMELAYVFRTTLQTIPVEVPYVRVAQRIVAARRKELEAIGWRERRFNIGLVWSSGNWNRDRDIPLPSLAAPLAAIPGVSLFSLQRDASAEAGCCARRLRITPTEREGADILATAAAICCMDLVVSVDTMVAHLAGALGRPVWTLLPFHADWRWMTGRKGSPWYPSMRLFRQNAPHDWCGAVCSLARALRAETAQRHRVV